MNNGGETASATILFSWKTGGVFLAKTSEFAFKWEGFAIGNIESMAYVNTIFDMQVERRVIWESWSHS